MLYETIFIITFVSMFVIVTIKFYNVLSHKDVEQRILRDKMNIKGLETPFFPYDIRMTWTLFFIFLFTYLVNLIVFMLCPEEILFMQGFRISTFFLVLVVIFSILELIYKVEEEAQKPIKALGGE